MTAHTVSPRQSLESELEKILEKVFTDMGIVLRAHPENIDIIDKLEEVGENQLRAALLKTVDRYVEERELLARIDEVFTLMGEMERHGLDDGITYSKIYGRHELLKAKLKALRQQVKETS